MFLLAQAFCDRDFLLDPQHPQMETWGTNDAPSIHSAVPAASDLMPKRNTMIDDTLFIYFTLQVLFISQEINPL